MTRGDTAAVIREESIFRRASLIAKHGSIVRAVESGEIEQFDRVSVSEAGVLGLFAQGVRKYVGVFGHGSTDLGHILSIYERAGLIRTWNVRSEIEAAHCATMLRWHYGEAAAVVTSIGPGALHALAGSLAAASNGIGVYHIYGDETTHDEGYNMQQIPRPEQHGYLELVKTMGDAYCLHTPEAVFTALRRGCASVFRPGFQRPFYLLLPMNVQPLEIEKCNLLEFPVVPTWTPVRAADTTVLEQAADLALKAERITIKFGGGAEGCGAELLELAELVDAVIVSGAKMAGVVPYSHERFMSVGGSKGSPCGNVAMAEADLAIVVGARAVCQWDCSGTAWKRTRALINFNIDPYDAAHYNRSIAVLGDAKVNLRAWIEVLRSRDRSAHGPARRDAADQANELVRTRCGRQRTGRSPWLEANLERKAAWQTLKQVRFDNPVLFDERWDCEVLTQPAAIRIATDFAESCGAACYFDSGDVQANGFQIVEEEVPGRVYSETGSSYMGFAASALLASALADDPVYAFAMSGDGSFTMNPQILFDAVEHHACGCVIVLDNRCMGAIAGLQEAQYGQGYKTSDSVEIDYVALARAVRGVNALHGGTDPGEFRLALETAREYEGLSLIHLPVYSGSHEYGGLGVYGQWNVGNWCGDVQCEHHRLGL